MRTDDIKNFLHEKIMEYSKELGALDTEVIDAPKFYVCNIVLKRNIVSVGYNHKDKIMFPASTLFCFIRPLKNREVFFNLCEIMTMINQKDLRCTVFPYIESEKRMDDCFGQLTSLIDEILPQMNNLLSDKTEYDNLIKHRAEELKRIYNVSTDLSEYDSEEAFVVEWQELYEDYLICNLTNSDRYQKFLQGNYNRAKKKYKKVIDKGKAFEYEKLIYIFMLGHHNDFEVIPEKCYTYKTAKSLDGPRIVLKTTMVLYPLFALFYIVFGLAIQSILAKDAVFCDSMDWYYNLIFAFLPSFLLGIFYRGKILRFVGRKDLVEFDDISMTKKQRKRYGVLIWLIIVVSVLFTLRLNYCFTFFYKDKIVSNDTADILEFDYKEYYYKDVEKIYYIKGRYNDWDEYIHRGSYVLVYNNGEKLDLDLIVTKEEVKKYMLPYIDKEVEVVNSDRDVE